MTGPTGPKGDDDIAATFVFDTTAQPVGATNTFIPITLNTNVQLDGWAHPAGSSIFTATRSGTYVVTYNAEVLAQFSGLIFFGIQAWLPGSGTAVPGSTLVDSTFNNSEVISVSKTFTFTVTAGQTVQFRWTGTNTGFVLTPDSRFPSSAPSFAVTIQKVN